MIFASCGSTTFGFERMMQALAALPAGELHVQHGPCDPPPCAEAYEFLPFPRMAEKIEQADVVVSHAGAGSIICAIRAGHTPVVFPRLKRYAEAVDDHQADLAKALAAQGSALVAWTADDLVAAVEAARGRRQAPRSSGSNLAGAVRRAVRGDRLLRAG